MIGLVAPSDGEVVAGFRTTSDEIRKNIPQNDYGAYLEILAKE
jgi:hypothetical protein